MASAARRLDSNVDGDFFVDDSCIDCDTCRWMAPGVYAERDGYAYVHTQPESPAALRDALQALVACPTGSIGTEQRPDVSDLSAARDAFPVQVDGPVHHCGYHHRDSFGAASYLLLRESGNILVDSPRFNRRLVRRLEDLGGVRWMFLTHRDDVADHAKFASHFGCQRILHADDVSRSTRGVEIQIRGLEPTTITDGITVIPTPGHTRGSACLLADETYLFTGDHLAWSRRLERVYAFRRACWYDWSTQIESMKRLAEYRFSWILPGHGRRCTFPADEMARRMQRCIRWMQKR